MVYDYEINGIKYNSYSQAVPSDTDGDRSLIKFYLFFIIQADNSYEKEYVTAIKKDLYVKFLLIESILGGGFIIVLVLIVFLVNRTARRITVSIDVMTEYTNELKKAPDLASKIALIDKISKDDPLFE